MILRRIGLVLAIVLGFAALPAAAQDNSELRIKKLEAEVKALQRKVFPDGAGKYFTPEITPGSAPSDDLPSPSTGPVTDILARLDAVEAALARMTATSEENTNRAGKLEARVAALESANAAPAPAVSAPEPTSVSANTNAMTGTKPAPTEAGPAPERLAAVRAIERPVSADKGEDAYLYGYRLWDAKFYPEAQQQLKMTADKYPQHKRISYVRNLLGRAWLDDGKPGTAAQVFLQNYQADKKGDRAADSLLYLAVAMAKLKETKRACVALQEFADAYPQEATGRLATQYASVKSSVKCN